MRPGAREGGLGNLQPRFQPTAAYGAILVLLVLLIPSQALAWGPLAHVHLATTFLDEALPAVNAGLAALLSRNLRDFLYGTLAADVILRKNAASYLHHCHNWLNVLRLFKVADSDARRAFLHGYMAHLAADVVAHNAFVPVKRIESFDGRVAGHALWEIRVERMMRARGDTLAHLRDLARADMSEHDRFLGRFLLGTVIKDFGLNKRIFDGVLGLQTKGRWERMVAFMGDVSRFAMLNEDLEVYEREVRLRLIELFRDPEANPLGHLDPRGTLAMAVAGEIRAELQKLMRLKLLGNTRPEDVRELFQPFFLGVARGDAVLVPNLSELFSLVEPGSGRPPRGKRLLARVVARARDQARLRKEERRARKDDRRERKIDVEVTE